MSGTAAPEASTGHPHRHSLLTSEGRAARPSRNRVRAAFLTVAALHVIGLGLLVLGAGTGAAGAVTVAVAAFAYFRGLCTPSTSTTSR